MRLIHASDSTGKGNEMIAAFLMMVAAGPTVSIESKFPQQMQWNGHETGDEMYRKTLFRYDFCTFQGARHYAISTKEPAEAIAEGALGDCTDFILLLRRAMLAMASTLPPEMMDKTMDDLVNIRRSQLIGYVMQVRSKAKPARH
jgi:hypothetical protein